MLFVRVTMTEGNVRMWDMDLMVGFCFWDVFHCCASVWHFGGAAVVAMAYGESV